MFKANHYRYVSTCSDVASSSSCYTLIARQQPIHTRISTSNERDRRPIDPPPIIQIKHNNSTPQQTNAFYQNSYFFMCANLAHPINDNEIYTPTHNALSGQTVSSMYKLKDIDNNDGAFFIFGDLSVKVEGSFRLKLSLFEITTTGSICLQSIFTEPFIVYPTKKFPGMLDSTFLSRSFSHQGARIRIRKENRAQLLNNPLASQTSRKRKPDVKILPNSVVCAPVPLSMDNKFNSCPVTNQNLPIALSTLSHNTLTNTATPIHSSIVHSPSTQATCSSLERRTSITSNGTESCSSNEGSPIMTYFSSPRISLPPLSPPHHHNYDKFSSPISYLSSLPTTSSFIYPTTTTPVFMDQQIKLPPIRNIFKRQKNDTTEIKDAADSLIQLSYNNRSLLHSPF